MRVHSYTYYTAVQTVIDEILKFQIKIYKK